jgi:hypothetical protein
MEPFKILDSKILNSKMKTRITRKTLTYGSYVFPLRYGLYLNTRMSEIKKPISKRIWFKPNHRSG